MLAWKAFGSGAPVVMVHGWGQQKEVFSPLLPFLENYRLLLPDLPGHGDSRPFSTDGLSCWRDALCRWLVSTVTEPVHLVGWSLGGTLLLDLLTHTSLPVNVRSLTLISATPCFIARDQWPGMAQREVERLAAGLQRDQANALASFNRLMFPAAQPPAELLTPGADLASLNQGLTILAEVDLRAELRQLRLPLMQLHGTQDRVVDVEAAKAVVTMGPRQLHLLEGVGHAPFIERPHDCASRIREFIDAR